MLLVWLFDLYLSPSRLNSQKAEPGHHWSLPQHMMGAQNTLVGQWSRWCDEESKPRAPTRGRGRTSFQDRPTALSPPSVSRKVFSFSVNLAPGSSSSSRGKNCPALMRRPSSHGLPLGLHGLCTRETKISCLARCSPKDPWFATRCSLVKKNNAPLPQSTQLRGQHWDWVSALSPPPLCIVWTAEVCTAALLAWPPQEPASPRSRDRELRAGRTAVQSPRGRAELRHWEIGGSQRGQQGPEGKGFDSWRAYISSVVELNGNHKIG